MATAEPGMKLSDAGKQYSQASSKALKRLDSLDRKFEGLNHRIEDVAAIKDETNDTTEDNITRLIKAKNELAQIAGDLERLQCRELDAIETAELSSGKAEARSHRKSLNVAVDNLIRRTQNLHNDFVSTVEKLKSGKLQDDLGLQSSQANGEGIVESPKFEDKDEIDNMIAPTHSEAGGASRRKERRKQYFKNRHRRRGMARKTDYNDDRNEQTVGQRNESSQGESGISADN